MPAPIRYGESAQPATTTTTSTTVQVTLDTPAAAGENLFLAVCVDKVSGKPWTPPAGFTTLFEHSAASVSGAVFHKTAAGGEQTLTASWPTAGTVMAIAAAYQKGTVGTVTRASHEADGATAAGAGATTLAVPAVAVGAAGGYAVSFAGQDTGSSWETTRPSAAAPIAYRDHAVVWDGASTYNNGVVLGDGDYTASQSAGTTWTFPASDQAWGVLIPVTTTATTPTFTRRWVGVPETTAIRVHGLVAGTTDVRLRVQGGPTSTAVTPDAQGYARLRLAGLTAGTTYTAEVIAADGTVLSTFTVRTAPTAATSFTFGFASCRDSGQDPPIFTAIRNQAPAFFLQIGDFHYGNIATNDPAAFRAQYDQLVTGTNIAGLLANVPTGYWWDDHDFGPDDSDGTSASKPAAQSVYKERTPHFDLPRTGDIGGTFTWGRVRFIAWDCRSNKSPKGATNDTTRTMLGTAQRDATLSILSAETLPLVVIISPPVWNQAAADNTDQWGGYAYERGLLADAMNAARGRGVRTVVVSGDAHLLCADNGSSANNLGCDMQLGAAPLHMTQSNKGGPYSAGSYFSPNGVSGAGTANNWGRVEVTDNGSQITVAFTGFSYTDTASAGTSQVALSETYRPGTPIAQLTIPSRTTGTAPTGGTRADLEAIRDKVNEVAVAVSAAAMSLPALVTVTPSGSTEKTAVEKENLRLAVNALRGKVDEFATTLAVAGSGFPARAAGDTTAVPADDVNALVSATNRCVTAANG